MVNKMRGSMKHLLPVLALTTLAVSSARAADQGLSYQYVSFGYETLTNTKLAGHSSGYSLTAVTKIGDSNFLLGAYTTIGKSSNTSPLPSYGNGNDGVYFGYVFTDVAGLADLALNIGSNEKYSLRARKNLGNGFEAMLGYSRWTGANRYEAGIGYSFSQNLSLDYTYSRLGTTVPTTGSYFVLNTIALRYNF